MIELDDKKTILQNRVRNSRKKHERICYNAQMIKNSHNSDATKNPELDLGVAAKKNRGVHAKTNPDW